MVTTCSAPSSRCAASCVVAWVSRRAVALDEQQVARMAVAGRAPEVVEAHVIERGAGGEAGGVTAQVAGLAVGTDHGGHRVPADDGTQAPFDGGITGGFGFQARGDGVDVFGGGRERQERAGTAGQFHHAFQQLVRTQFVAGTQDGVGRVGGVTAHQFELAQHRRAIARDRGADARNHRVVTGDRFALVVHGETIAGDAHVAAQRVQHPDRVAALACGLHQPAGRVQLAVARQDGELHGRGITWAAYSIARPEGRTMTTEARRGMERVMGTSSCSQLVD